MHRIAMHRTAYRLWLGLVVSSTIFSQQSLIYKQFMKEFFAEVSYGRLWLFVTRYLGDDQLTELDAGVFSRNAQLEEL